MADLLFPLLDLSRGVAPGRVAAGAPRLMTGGGSFMTTDGFPAPARQG